MQRGSRRLPKLPLGRHVDAQGGVSDEILYVRAPRASFRRRSMHYRSKCVQNRCSGVISAPEGEFPTGLRTNGQLRRHFDARRHVLAAITYESPSRAPFSRRSASFCGDGKSAASSLSHQLLSIPPWQSFCTAAFVADDRGPSAAQVRLEGFNAPWIGYKDSD